MSVPHTTRIMERRLVVVMKRAGFSAGISWIVLKILMLGCS